ncbi:MAG: hypothetical protein WB444_03640, partial [Gallionella sp.]
LELRGAFEKNPRRKMQRQGEPAELKDIGPAPKRLTAKQREAWAVIVGSAHFGVLSSADAVAVEMAAVLLAAFWQLGIEMKGCHMARLDSLLARFGMTPADRSRVVLKQGRGLDNPFLKHVRPLSTKRGG